MPGIILAGAGTPQQVVLPAQFPGLSAMTWTDQGGAVWDLLDGTNGVALTRGVRGMGMPPIDRFSTGLAGLAGSQHTGFRVRERDVFWPLLIQSGVSSQDWVDLDTSFWAGMRPDWVGSWTVTQPNGVSRSLACRFSTDNDPSFDIDPSLGGWVVYGVNLVAEAPFWTGTTLRRDFAPSNSAPFLSSSGIWISRGDTTAAATATNRGDVDAWPVYTIFGPTTSVDLGVSGRTIQVHFAVAAGHALIIDTDPTQRTALDATVSTGPDGSPLATPTGTDLTSQLGQTAWAPVPVGKDVPLNLAATGTGSIRVELRQQFFKAW